MAARTVARAKGGRMTDILERLLALNEADRGAIEYEPYDFGDLAYEAAEEIKRLRMQLMTLERLMEGHFEMQRRWDGQRMVTKTRKVRSDSNKKG